MRHHNRSDRNKTNHCGSIPSRNCHSRLQQSTRSSTSKGLTLRWDKQLQQLGTQNDNRQPRCCSRVQHSSHVERPESTDSARHACQMSTCSFVVRNCCQQQQRSDCMQRSQYYMDAARVNAGPGEFDKAPCPGPYTYSVDAWRQVTQTHPLHLWLPTTQQLVDTRDRCMACCWCEQENECLE
jgi:hypothetical protein